MVELLINLDNDYCEFSPAYNELVQGVIYKLLSSDPNISNKVHNDGYCFDDISYKLYTFSGIIGDYHYEKSSISFKGDISIAIRSYKNEIIYILANALRKSENITLGRNNFHVRSFEFKSLEMLDNQYIIRMLTPIDFHTKIGNEDVNLTCNDDKFYESISNNVVRKYKQIHGKDKDIKFIIEPIEISENSVIRTSFKQTKITASYGVYRITGDREILNFAYYTGLGRRNSQGFGMFEVIC